MTKYNGLGGLNNTQLFLTVLEAGRSRSGCQHGPVLGEPFSRLDMATCSLCPPLKERARASSLVSAYKGTNLISSEPNYLPKALLANTLTQRVRAMTYEFGKDWIQSMTVVKFGNMLLRVWKQLFERIYIYEVREKSKEVGDPGEETIMKAREDNVSRRNGMLDRVHCCSVHKEGLRSWAVSEV